MSGPFPEPRLLKKRIVILAALPVLCLLTYSWLDFHQAKNPMHRGRLVSDWVHDALDSELGERNSEAHDVAADDVDRPAVSPDG